MTLNKIFYSIKNNLIFMGFYYEGNCRGRTLVCSLNGKEDNEKYEKKYI